ncbi:unnamed protein product [Laminaria digitata]
MASVGKKFVNDPDKIVSEMLEGLVNVCNPGRLIKLPGHDVVLRADVSTVKQRQVTLISGGGSGHEPAFAGYVGEGMLTAAVCGGVFASPASSAVLEAIRATCGPSGCLVLVMNYTGDRINFGKAIEQAKAEGFNVRMHVVADDCALPRDKGITGRRGVAGAILVAKVAGAAAEAGLSLEEVMTETAAAAQNVGTLGVALTTCTHPGKQPSSRLDADTIEIGLGIHGEAGIKQTGLQTADALTDVMISAVVDPEGEGGEDYLPLAPGQRVAVLVNSLGATPPMELLLIARRATSNLKGRGARVERVYCGAFMTSLDMAGASVTVMRVDVLSLARLDAAADTPGWRDAHGTRSKRPPHTSLPDISAAISAGMDASTSQGRDGSRSHQGPAVFPGEWSAVERATRAATAALIAAEPELTKWDCIAGDGDCGTTFKRGAEALLDDLDGGRLPKEDLRTLLRALSDSVGESMGGTMGGVLQIFFSAGEASLSSLKPPGSTAGCAGREGGEAGGGGGGGGGDGVGAAWCRAFVAGVEGVEFYGGAKAGMRTVLDAIVPAAEVFQSNGPSGGCFGEAVAAAEEGAESTCNMEALAGRANYVAAESLMGVPDPGAKAAAYALRAILETLISA